jgi:hypothetical protein
MKAKGHRYIDYPVMDVLQMTGCACRPLDDDRYSIARSRLGIEVPSLIPLSVTVRTHLIKHFLDLFPLWSESTRLQTQGQLLALRSSLEWVALGVRWESHWWLPVAIKSSSLGDGRIRTRRYVNICVFSHFSVLNQTRMPGHQRSFRAFLLAQEVLCRCSFFFFSSV